MNGRKRVVEGNGVIESDCYVVVVVDFVVNLR